MIGSLATMKVGVALLCLVASYSVSTRGPTFRNLRGSFPRIHFSHAKPATSVRSVHTAALATLLMRLRGGRAGMTDQQFQLYKQVKGEQMQAAMGGYFDQDTESSSDGPKMFLIHKVCAPPSQPMHGISNAAQA